MVKTHHAFIFSGLGDYIKPINWITAHWKEKYTVIPHAISVGWEDTSTSFEEKQNTLYNTVLPYIRNKTMNVSFIGLSAGASAAVNLWLKLRKNNIVFSGKLISICGRFIKGDKITFRTLNYASKNSPSFLESVQLCEENLKLLSLENKKRILTYRIAGDEVVPGSTSVIEGATNRLIPSLEHTLSIGLILAFYGETICKFIQSP